MKTFVEIGWCKPAVIYQFKGYSVEALRKLKERGLLAEGIHWKKFNGSLHFHFEAFNEWIDTDGRI